MNIRPRLNELKKIRWDSSERLERRRYRIAWVKQRRFNLAPARLELITNGERDDVKQITAVREVGVTVVKLIAQAGGQFFCKIAAQSQSGAIALKFLKG